MLASGRPVPDAGSSYQRGGVTIVLLDWAVQAWKEVGSQWKAWSSKLVTACLQVGKKKHAMHPPGQPARRRTSFMMIWVMC